MTALSVFRMRCTSTAETPWSPWGCSGAESCPRPPPLCQYCKATLPPDRPVWGIKPGMDCSYGIFLRIISWLISLCSLTEGKMSGVNSGLELENETSFSLFKLRRSCIISFSTALQNPTNTGAMGC